MLGPAGSVDDGAALMVERSAGPPSSELLARWSTGAARLLHALDAMDLSTRVTWVAGELSARTLATTRLAETWIHTGDVAGALGVTLAPDATVCARSPGWPGAPCPTPSPRPAAPWPDRWPSV